MSEAEKYINEHTRHCSNELVPSGYHEWVTPDNALRACEIIKQETIKKAKEWLADRVSHDSIDYPMATEHLIDDFHKVMEK